MLEYVLYIQLLGSGYGYDRLEFKGQYPQSICMSAGQKIIEAMPDKVNALYWCNPDNEQLKKLMPKSIVK